MYAESQGKLFRDAPIANSSSAITDIVWFSHRRPRTVEAAPASRSQEVAVDICPRGARPVRVAAARATSLAGSAGLS